ncbi:hypothetical protein IFR04_010068 [Cadophora malorum]|uniref:Uncharacterized protein n=1 Tax=Cadophora malorum TaxID=108018 RepID=A0A8H7TDH5_9HELO|nr:hypothetical protein IFR04_010068 [Cadophora malorum]
MDNFNATSTNSTASVNTTTAAHMQLERGTGRPDIWLAAGYLTLVIIIILVILANVFHKRIRAAWSPYRSNARTKNGTHNRIRQGASDVDMNEAREMEDY